MDSIHITTICFLILLSLEDESKKFINVLSLYAFSPLILAWYLYTYILHLIVKPLLKTHGIIVKKNPFVNMTDRRLKINISMIYNLPITSHLFVLYHQVIFKELKGALLNARNK